MTRSPKFKLELQVTVQFEYDSETVTSLTSSPSRNASASRPGLSLSDSAAAADTADTVTVTVTAGPGRRVTVTTVTVSVIVTQSSHGSSSCSTLEARKSIGKRGEAREMACLTLSPSRGQWSDTGVSSGCKRWAEHEESMDSADSPLAKRRCSRQGTLHDAQIMNLRNHEPVQTSVTAEILAYISGCLQRQGQVEPRGSINDNLELLKACEVNCMFLTIHFCPCALHAES